METFLSFLLKRKKLHSIHSQTEEPAKNPLCLPSVLSVTMVAHTCPEITKFGANRDVTHFADYVTLQH